jgi:hypothetical protein
MDCGEGLPGTPIILRNKRLSPSMDPYDSNVLSQKFHVVKNGKFIMIVSALNIRCMLDLTGAIHDFGKGDVLRLCPTPKQNPIMSTSIEDVENFTHQQQWKFGSKKHVAPYVPLKTPVLLKNKLSKMYINTQGQHTDGTAPIMFKLGFKNRAWRKFVIDEHGFISPIGNLNCVLACVQGVSGEGITLQQKKETDNLNQRWQIGLCHLKKYRIIMSALNPDLVLDVKENVLVICTNNRSLDRAQKWSVKVK